MLSSCEMGISPQIEAEVGEAIQENEGCDKFVEVTYSRQVVWDELHEARADVGEINSRE